MLWQCRRTCDPLLMSPFACSSLSWFWFLVGVQGGKKGRIVQVGGGVEGGCSVAGSAAAAAFAAAASPCAERWMWTCTLSVAVSARGRNQNQPPRFLFQSTGWLAQDRGRKQPAPCSKLAAMWAPATHHCRRAVGTAGGGRQSTTMTEESWVETCLFGSEVFLEQQSRCWGVKAGFSSDPWRLVRVLHPRGPWVQAAFERRCRSACTCHHLWVQISGFPS